MLADLADKLRTALWFIPALMAVSAAVLAFVLVRAQDMVPEEWLYQSRWLASGDPEGARQILATIAGSVITVTGVIFSVTLVALSLASQQFGPRLLRNFMRDRGNQIVLGTFIATFLYAMLVLRVVHGPGDDAQTPYLAVTFAVALALVALAVLIYFIHHVVQSIQADTIILNVVHELHDTIGALYPDRNAQAVDEGGAPQVERPEPARAVASRRTGYVRAVNVRTLLDVAHRHHLLIRVAKRPGKFIIKGEAVAHVHVDAEGAEGLRDVIDDRICKSILVGRNRTAEQDVEFCIAQLVEIAVRSLSPSLNDPFTAMTCLDRLGEALVELGTRTLPNEQSYGRQGKVRLIVPRADYQSMVSLSFDQIRQNSRDSPAVIIRMLEVIALVMNRLGRNARCNGPLLRQAQMVANVDPGLVPEEHDRQAVAERYEICSALV
jgi:uncharacterized membrane protein